MTTSQFNLIRLINFRVLSPANASSGERTLILVGFEECSPSLLLYDVF